MNESKKHQEIVFFFIIDGIGGVQNLFLNIIKELYKKNIKVKLVYYNNSWLTRELDRANIQYKLFDLRSDKVENLNHFVNSKDILITTYLGKELYYFYKSNPYFIFWNVFPTTFKINTKWHSNLKKIFLKRKIVSLHKNNGLLFMDDTATKNIENCYHINEKFNYLPIPIEIPEENSIIDFSLKLFKEEIQVSYIGRAENWKIIPVIKLLEDLKEIGKNLSKIIVLHIITDNPENFSELLKYDPCNFIKIEYHKELFGGKLKEFLKKEILINFAMGTSCLESASVGVPSILLDACFSSYPSDYKYRWIFQTQGYSLGNIVEEHEIVEGTELINIFKNLLSNNYYIKDISDKCIAYAKENHSLESVTDNFIIYIGLCNNKLKPFLRRSLNFIKYKIGIL